MTLDKRIEEILIGTQYGFHKDRNKVSSVLPNSDGTFALGNRQTAHKSIKNLITTELIAELEATIDGHMNGFHPGDWEVAIKHRIEELKKGLK